MNNHIELPKIPGIVAMLTAYPETGDATRILAQALLFVDSASFSRKEREAIAAVVSENNNTPFCFNSHRAACVNLCGGDEVEAKDLMYPLKRENPKMFALHSIAASVRVCQPLIALDVEDAKAAGADDRTIHDTVLIAAAFCMFNRYVTALNPTEASAAEYAAAGARIGMRGYIVPKTAEVIL